MVAINKENGNFVFEVKGLHKLWAFKNQLTIPAEHITGVHQNTNSVSGWKGWRIPGTSIPGIITAGTYYKKDGKTFWDVCNMNKSIVVELKDENYDKLVIEVENPENAIKTLTN